MAHLSLRSLGFPDAEARHTVETFRDYDIDRLYAHRDIHRDEAKMIRAAQDWAKELEELFEHDAARNPAAVD